jgi:hypothetical protein
MSRIINVNSPGKLRNQLMRTSAEVIRHLGQKTEVDSEVRDMAALLVFCFRQIDQGVDDSARAWEKRDYWVKAEQFRARWLWVGQAADQIEELILEGSWEMLPSVLVGLLPYFEDIRIAKFTRKPSLWKGAYERLVKETTKKV